MKLLLKILSHFEWYFNLSIQVTQVYFILRILIIRSIYTCITYLQVFCCFIQLWWLLQSTVDSVADKQLKFISDSSGGGKSKIRMVAQLRSGEGLQVTNRCLVIVSSHGRMGMRDLLGLPVIREPILFMRVPPHGLSTSQRLHFLKPTFNIWMLRGHKHLVHDTYVLLYFQI